MIGISKLYCGAVEPGDVLRYRCHSGDLPSHLLQFFVGQKARGGVERHPALQLEMRPLLCPRRPPGGAR